MRRVAVFLLALTFLVPSAHGWDLTKKVAAPWWIHGLTFYAPFDDPASPLKLLRGAGALTFTRAHDATHTATYVHPGTGLVTVADNNQLRIEAGGALVEGARTNKALYSEALGLASTWIPVSMTVDNNSVVAPNGNTTAETLTATGDNAVLYQAIAGTHLDYVYSAYLKRKTGTGTVSVSADNATWTTCTIDNASWTRCSDIRHYPDTSVQNPGIRIATSGDAVYAWGTQLEGVLWTGVGDYASSYIPTVASAISRNADLLSFTASGNVSNTVGTLSVEIKKPITLPAQTTHNTFLGSGSPSIGLYNTQLLSVDNTSTVYSGVLSADMAETKIALRWGSDRKFSQDGALSATKAFSGDMNHIGSGITYIGYATGNAGSYYHAWGNIKNLRIWNRALTDAELKAITR